MNRLIILLFSIFLIGCCNETKLLKNGLTKKANKITIYYIKIESNSLNNKVQDTTSIREKKYNNNDQIFNLFQKTLFDNETLEIDYIYNDLNKIKTEIVKMSTDSLPFKVNYIYKDSLLYQSKSIIENTNEKFEQIETYYYRKNNSKEKTITTQIFIDLKSSDTIRNSVSTSYFDKNEIVTKVETVHKSDPKRNQKLVYEHDCQNLISLKEFNGNDSLVSTLKYKYKLDEFDNWIERRIFENGDLDRILKREIKYK